GRCIETSRKGVSKGSSIRRLSEMGLFDMKDTIGIGDSMNDLEMLKTCAYGIAMGNGEEELKKKADMITDRIEDDGFYKAFERLGMI
ncbi:MAG: HAD hydrolase family protein, partial [Erysipelotrichaceae bacterium]|nr:HAD hydrolase family protein [Erysipelotrichaceae bacterium]